MNRTEFMTHLAALLQDIPVEERRDAMQYYNDYFDDAGVENEQQVIKELESPQKVAAKIKADFKMSGQDAGNGQFTETGYQDARFEQMAAPSAGYTAEDSARQQKNDRTLKIVLIILIVLVGLPVALPLAAGVLAAVFGIIAGVFGFLLALVVTSFAIAVAGVSLVVAGVIYLLPELAVGLALIGVGLIITVIGVIFIVGSVKLCAVAIPGICRGIVWLCRRPFQRKVVA